MGKEIRVAIYRRVSVRRDRREIEESSRGGKRRYKAPSDGGSLLSPKI